MRALRFTGQKLTWDYLGGGQRQGPDALAGSSYACRMVKPSFWLRGPQVILGAVVVLGALAACSPAFNWRDVRPDETALSLLLPCKPDIAQQTVPMGGRPTTLTLLGCDAGGATFAVAVADVTTAFALAGVLGQWQAVTLAGIKAPADTTAVPFNVPGARLSPPAVRVSALGRRGDGSAVRSQALYFAHGTQVFQVVMLSSQPAPEAEEIFFSNVRLK